ncbi:MAG: LPS export ABC transporter periplasmic protein LptC [Propionivibrio sp.]
MKQWGSAIFPLSILFVLGVLTFWLRYATEIPESKHDGKNRHDPDYIVGDATLSKLDTTGALKYTLTAKDIRHYPDDDSTDLIAPSVLYLDADKPPLTMTSDTGHVSKDGDQVDLHGNVHIRRTASPKEPELNAYMPELTVLPDDEKAFTEHPVRITRGAASWVTGTGMKVDNKARTYVLESQVRGVIESQRAKKKNP